MLSFEKMITLDSWDYDFSPGKLIIFNAWSCLRIIEMQCLLQEA
jgi:hypothetical protein